MSKKFIAVLLVGLASSAVAEEKTCETKECKQIATGAALAVGGTALFSTIDPRDRSPFNDKSIPVSPDELFSLKPQKGDLVVIEYTSSLADSKKVYVKNMEEHIERLKDGYTRLVEDGRIADSLDQKFRVEKAEHELRQLKAGKVPIQPMHNQETVRFGAPGEKSIFDVQQEIKKKKGTILGARHITLKSPSTVRTENLKHNARAFGGLAGLTVGAGMMGAGLLSDGSSEDSENVEELPVQVAE